VREEGIDATWRLAALRGAFDQAFSEPAARGGAETEGLLAIRSGGCGYAVHLAEVGGLFVDRTIVRLPSPLPQFLGVAGLRHDVVPVYSLSGLLGHGAGGGLHRWLLVVRASHPVALAFEEFDGHLRVLPSAIAPAASGAQGMHVSATVRHAETVRGLVSLASLMKAIDDRGRAIGTRKEQ
jgi:chemotaxis signal transduction protein